jgi:hypothetical protein
MKPFDRNYFASWIGALLKAMRHIGKEALQRHGAKESGLRWANRLPGFVATLARWHRIALRAAPARKADLPPSN